MDGWVEVDGWVTVTVAVTVGEVVEHAMENMRIDVGNSADSRNQITFALFVFMVSSIQGLKSVMALLYATLMTKVSNEEWKY